MTEKKTAATTQSSAADVVPAQQELQNQRHFKILIPETSDKNEQSRVFVSVNGIGRWILRGVEAIVPEAYVKVLQDAVRRIYVPIKDPETGVITMQGRNAQSYPFMNLGEVDRDANSGI